MMKGWLANSGEEPVAMGRPSSKTPMTRSEVMSRIRKKDTKPELRVRKVLWAMGYRYRLHRTDLPGTPDLVFVRQRKVVFVHGCFWHQHGCHLSKLPKSNTQYWHPKLRRNVERDAAARSALESAGWKTLVIWECESKRDDLPDRLQQFLND
jgi:DNA mismatch endonuclease (patch repair protein)